MMYSVYEPETGKIEFISNQPPPGMPCIEGEWHPNFYRVVNGQAVPEVAAPSIEKLSRQAVPEVAAPSIEKLSRQVRQQRNQLLTAVDRVNPVWYNTLTDQQRGELAAYRQALLDVPQQSGFPESVVWPTQPTWF